MKYLFKFMFPFLRSGVEAKRGVEFRHSARNASRIRKSERFAESRERGVLTVGSLCLTYCVRDTA